MDRNQVIVWSKEKGPSFLGPAPQLSYCLQRAVNVSDLGRGFLLTGLKGEFRHKVPLVRVASLGKLFLRHPTKDRHRPVIHIQDQDSTISLESVGDDPMLAEVRDVDVRSTNNPVGSRSLTTH